MSLEIDLLNTYPVCGREPSGASDLIRPVQRDLHQRTATETVDAEAPPTRAIVSSGLHRFDMWRWPDGDAPRRQE